jgi:hypothetical protein
MRTILLLVLSITLFFPGASIAGTLSDDEAKQCVINLGRAIQNIARGSGESFIERSVAVSEIARAAYVKAKGRGSRLWTSLSDSQREAYISATKVELSQDIIPSLKANLPVPTPESLTVENGKHVNRATKRVIGSINGNETIVVIWASTCMVVDAHYGPLSIIQNVSDRFRTIKFE